MVALVASQASLSLIPLPQPDLIAASEFDLGRTNRAAREPNYDTPA